MTEQLRIECLTRAPVSIDGELHWLEPGEHTLPWGIAQMLINHDMAREVAVSND